MVKMANMEQDAFKAGELKHKTTITLMQIITAFFTALALGSIYSPHEDIFGIPKLLVVLFSFLVAFFTAL